jgi:hypothetical protein
VCFKKKQGWLTTILTHSNWFASMTRVQTFGALSSCGWFPSIICRIFSIPIRWRIGQYSRASSDVGKIDDSPSVKCWRYFKDISDSPPTSLFGTPQRFSAVCHFLTPVGQHRRASRTRASSPSYWTQRDRSVSPTWAPYSNIDTLGFEVKLIKYTIRVKDFPSYLYYQVFDKPVKRVTCSELELLIDVRFIHLIQ